MYFQINTCYPNRIFLHKYSHENRIKFNLADVAALVNYPRHWYILWMEIYELNCSGMNIMNTNSSGLTHGTLDRLNGCICNAAHVIRSSNFASKTFQINVFQRNNWFRLHFLHVQRARKYDSGNSMENQQKPRKVKLLFIIRIIRFGKRNRKLFSLFLSVIIAAAMGFFSPKN